MSHRARAKWLFSGTAALFLLVVAPYADGAPTPAFGNRVIVEAVKRLRPAVVHIRVTPKSSSASGFTGFFGPKKKGDAPSSPFGGLLPGNPAATGSGIIVSEDGFILTNHHVIKNAEKIQVKLHDGTELKGLVVGVDDKTDLALLKVETGQKLPTAPMGDSDTVEVGEWVFAIGSPYGLPQSVSVGIVSAVGRNLGQGPYDNFIQTDASINPGNSGGPLANSRGEVIGINTAIFTRGRRFRDIGLGFAIPINQAKAVIDDLRHKGYPVRGRLGVSVGKVPVEEGRKIGLGRYRGARLAHVVRGGPADKAGLRRGDVIVEFDKKTVVTWETLPRLVARARPEEEVEVKFYRGGKFETVRVRLGSRKEIPKSTRTEAWDELGMKVEALTSRLASRFSLRFEKGLVVSSVKRGGPAERGGVRVGDRIKEVNHIPVRTYSEFQKEMRRSRSEGSVLFLLRRRETEIFTAVRFP